MGLSYRPELDGLRAVAVLAVLLFHLGPHGTRILWWGYIGVDIFFVLSGYLITGNLLCEIERSGAIDFQRFFLHRAARLFPALLCLLAVSLTVFVWVFPALRASLWLSGGEAAFYLMDFTALIQGKDNPYLHTWSLAIEAQFYLVWPFVVLYLSRIRRDAAVAVLLVGWAAVTGIRDLAIFWGLPQIGYYTPLHSTGLMIGSALALMPKQRVGPFIGPLVFAIAIASGLSQSWIITLAEIAAALLISCPSAILGFPPLVWIGKISYGLYLWQIPIWFLVPKQNAMVAVAVSIAATFACASASYYLIERRVLASVASRKLLVA